MNEFGEYLRKARNDKSLTVNQLAIYSGLSAASRDNKIRSLIKLFE